MFGTIQSTLVLGQARDGHVFVRPFSFDPLLRALNAALASFGATRGNAAHGNFKSSARLLCPPERRTEFERWDTSFVHDTVDVLSLDSGTTALGSTFDSREHINLRSSVLITPPLRCSSPGSVLTCPSSCITSAFNGDLLDHDLLAAFDGQRRASVSASLSDLPDHLVAGHHGRPPAAGWA